MYSPHFFLTAVQNERHPRSTAHVSLDYVKEKCLKEHLSSTQELSPPDIYSSVIYKPLVHSSCNPNNHQFMVSLLAAETCVKLDPGDGKIMGGFLILQVSDRDIWDSQRSQEFYLFFMNSGRKCWCDNEWSWERSHSDWLSQLQLFRKYIRDVSPTPLHICQMGKIFACFCSLGISRPGKNCAINFGNVITSVIIISHIIWTQSGDSAWRSMEWDVPSVCYPVVLAYGQLSSSVHFRALPNPADHC